MVKNVEKSVVDNAMNLGGVDSDSSKEKRSQDGNPLDPMTTPILFTRSNRQSSNVRYKSWPYKSR